MTPIKLFSGAPNLISPFKEIPDIYGPNSPMKFNLGFASPSPLKGNKLYNFYENSYHCFVRKKICFI